MHKIVLVCRSSLVQVESPAINLQEVYPQLIVDLLNDLPVEAVNGCCDTELVHRHEI